MIVAFGHQKKKRHVKEIQLAPILDLLVVVIFFLILSSSFVDFTKQTLPPSSTTITSNPGAIPPLSPKLLALHRPAGTELILRWSGSAPGQNAKLVQINQDELEFAKDLQRETSSLVKEFMERHPAERSLQVSLGADLDYQTLVSIMDGAREHLQDLVLISYHEAAALAQGQ